MDIRFQGNYDKQTFLEALKLVQRSSLIHKILRWLALVLSVVTLGYALYLWATSGFTASQGARAIRSVVTALLLMSYYLSPYFRQRNIVSQLFRASPNRTMQGFANHEGIMIETDLGRVQFAWQRFYRKGRRDQLISIMTLDGMIALFHRDFFENAAEWSRFESLIEQKVVEPK